MKAIVNAADFANLSLLDAGPALREKLETAAVVSSDEVPADVLTMQSKVVLLDEATAERHLVRIVYPGERDPAVGFVSVLEPLGTALLGARVGDAVECGQRYRIEEIVYQPEKSLRTHLIVRK